MRGHPASQHGLLPRARIGQEAVGVQRSHSHCPLSWWHSDLAWDSATCPEVIFMGPWGMQAAMPCQRDR